MRDYTTFAILALILAALLYAPIRDAMNVAQQTNAALTHSNTTRR